MYWKVEPAMEPLVINRAPGDLELVRAFINSRNIEAETDDLSSPEQLRAWLAGRGLLRGDEPLSPGDFERAIRVRQALHGLVLAHNERRMDAALAALLNRDTAGSMLLVRFAEDGSASLVPGAGGIDGALGRLMAIVYTAMLEGTWHRLKACRNDGCQWAFYDPSRSRSGAWCSMAICGSRLKSKAYRRRHKPAPAH